MFLTYLNIKRVIYGILVVDLQAKKNARNGCRMNSKLFIPHWAGKICIANISGQNEGLPGSI